MQKTKLGISVGLLGAIMCFSTLFSGYFISLILLGYILLFESNEWLRKNSVKAVILLISFSAARTLIGLIPDAISLIDSVVSLVGGSFGILFVSRLVSLCNNVLSVLKTLVFLVLGFKAFNQGTIKIGFVDRMLDKHFSNSNVNQ